MKNSFIITIVSLLSFCAINSAAIINPDNRFDFHRNKTNLKHIVVLQLTTTNAELNQQEVIIDDSHDKKSTETIESPTLFKTSISAVISTSIRSTLKNRKVIYDQEYISLLKLVSKDVISSLTIKSIFWFIPKKIKVATQLSLFVLTNSYICYGKSLSKILNHLTREILKMLGYIALLSMISKFSKNFLVKAIYFGFLSFFWDYLVKQMTDNLFNNII